MLLFILYFSISNVFELITTKQSLRSVLLAAESPDDQQMWIIKLARVSCIVLITAGVDWFVVTTGVNWLQLIRYLYCVKLDAVKSCTINVCTEFCRITCGSLCTILLNHSAFLTFFVDVRRGSCSWDSEQQCLPCSWRIGVFNCFCSLWLRLIPQF